MIQDQKQPSQRKPIRAYVRSFYLILLTVLVTYFAKFHQYDVKPVRYHEALAWLLPTQNGLSALFVSADDGIDSNSIKTGHRVWVNPPKQPAKLTENRILFSGPKISVVGDSLSLMTVQQVAEMVDDGGFLYVLGKQLWDKKFLQGIYPKIHIYIDTLKVDSVPLSLGDDTRANLFFKNQKFSQLTVKTSQYHYVFAHGPQDIRSENKGVSVLAFTKKNVFSSQEKLITFKSSQKPGTLVARSTTWSTNPDDSSAVNLHEPNYAVAFFEDERFNQNRILLRKIYLEDWNSLSQ